MSKSRYQEKKDKKQPVKSFAELAPQRFISNLPDWPDMHQWVKDGEDHICIERKAKTELGRSLCLDNGDYPFTSRYFGKFNSLEGYWLYVTCPDFNRREHLRSVSGVALQGIRRDAMNTMVKTSNLRSIMMQAMYDRIVQNEKLRELFIENTLPFDMYHVDYESGRRMRAAHMMHMTYVCYHMLFECLSEGGDVESAIQHARNDKEGDMYAKLLPAYQVEWLKNQERIRAEKAERKHKEEVAQQIDRDRLAELAALDAAMEAESQQAEADNIIKDEVAVPVDEVGEVGKEPEASEVSLRELSSLSVAVDDNSYGIVAELKPSLVEVKPSDLTQEQVGSILMDHANGVIETIRDNQ